MAAPGPTLSLSVPNRIEDLTVRMDAVEAFLTAWAVAPDDLMQVMIILDEVASNIVKSAWPGGGEHSFLVELHIGPEPSGLDLLLRTTDDGVAFDPTGGEPPDLELSLEDREPGGLGLFMAKELSDGMTYHRTDGRNCLQITKRLHRAAEQPA